MVELGTLDNRALSALRTMVQQWKIQSWKLRGRGEGCPPAAPYYYEAANYLSLARLELEKAILEESTTE